MLAYCGDSDDENSSLDSNAFPGTASVEIVVGFDGTPKKSDDKRLIMIAYDGFRQTSLGANAKKIVSVILSIASILYTVMTGYSSSSTTPYFPVPVLELGKYRGNDFQNRNGVTIPYWQDSDQNERQLIKYAGTPHVGPCYLLRSEPDWNALIGENKQLDSGKEKVKFRSTSEALAITHTGGSNDLAGLCRPGFIIIGAGKCGTSSLYHYLTGHPRVLAAKNKQIDYYRYFGNRSMKWYLSNFPTAESFFSSGTLMTGEASPGYLPYPEIAHRLLTQMQNEAGSGSGSPKIITIVRNPLERSWSSFQYNYKRPVINTLRNEFEAESHDFLNVLHKKDKCYYDEWYYEHFVFSFEDMIRSELKLLKECLAPGGEGETSTSNAYGSIDWAKPLFERRRVEGLPALLALDALCYGDRISDRVPRRQWQDLIETYPHKIINLPNLHVVQSLVGRSIYVLPLEWWYALYPRHDLHVVCSEDLRIRASETMSNVSDFLGLPAFDYTDVTKAGMFNTGENSGYDTATKWSDNVNKGSSSSMNEIPISDELRKEFMDFVRPYNERLFQLTGKRCDW